MPGGDLMGNMPGGDGDLMGNKCRVGDRMGNKCRVEMEI